MPGISERDGSGLTIQRFPEKGSDDRVMTSLGVMINGIGATGITILFTMMTACTSGNSVVGNPTAPSSPLALTNVFVVQGTSDNGTSVMQFKATSPGNAIPVSTLTVPPSMNIISVATDSSGLLYVGAATDQGGEIIISPVNPTETATLPRTIMGGPGSFTFPYLMTIDSNGSLYVSDQTDCNCVFVFSSTASGTANPLRTIQGNRTQINDPVALAVDGTGNLYVADHFGAYSSAPAPGGAQINVFPPSATGNVAPIQVVTGTTTAPLSPILGMVADATSNLYVNYGATIVEYTPDSTSRFVPTNTIVPPAAETESSTLREDVSGNLFVLWFTVKTLTPNIAVYAKTASGLATAQSPFTTTSWTGTPDAEQFALR
jgi:hypothetical protein